MSLLVDGGGYRSAAHALRDGNHSLARAYDRFTSGLLSSGAMAGSDTAGASFAEAYDEAATCAVWAQLHLVGAFGSLADLTAVSAWNHESAERRSALVPGGSPYDGGTMPVDSAVTVFPREPPSSLGGDGAGPGWWDALADHVGGVLYPDADLPRLRDTGSAWIAQGQMIEQFAAQCETASSLLGVQRSPEIGDALAAYDGLSVETRAVASICLTVGEVCLGFADDVEQVRHDLEQLGRELLLWTAGTQAVTHGLALLSFGAAELPGQALQAARIAATAARARSLLSAFAAAVALRLGPLATVTRTATRSSTVLVKYASARVVLAGAASRSLPARATVVRRTIDDPRLFDPRSLAGLPLPMVRSMLQHWKVLPSRSGGGIRLKDPARHGRQVRLMPGYAPGSRADPLTTGPYAVVSQNNRLQKVPLEGNPVL